MAWGTVGTMREPHPGGVYVDPCDPGASQVGDVVVIAVDAAPGEPKYGWNRAGHTGVVYHAYRGTRTPHPWDVHVGSRLCVVHAVRHPTPEELAAYQLARG